MPAKQEPTLMLHCNVSLIRVWKIFLNSTFFSGQILYHFVSFMNEIFRSARISLLLYVRINSKPCSQLLNRLPWKLSRDKHSSLFWCSSRHKEKKDQNHCHLTDCVALARIALKKMFNFFCFQRKATTTWTLRTWNCNPKANLIKNICTSLRHISHNS